jgi:multidrug efflux pump subunit AcrA (membrane-fusion protein)
MNKRTDEVAENDLGGKFDPELLGNPPGRLITWGISIFGFFIALFFVGAGFIEYNDIIRAEVTISTPKPPIIVKAPRDGRIERLLIEQGKEVKEGDVIAVLDNSSDFKKILDLKKILIRVKEQDHVTIDSLLHELRKENYGEVQNELNAYLRNLESKKLYSMFGFPNQYNELMTKQIKINREIESNLDKKLGLFEVELSYGVQELQRNELLWKEKVISNQDFENLNRRVLSDSQVYQDLKFNLSTIQAEISRLETSLYQNRYDQLEEYASIERSINESFQVLIARIDLWIRANLIVAPDNGKLAYFGLITDFQAIKQDQGLFSVIFSAESEFLGKITIPLQNSGKVKVGNPVKIRLSSFPFQEWGTISGEVVSIGEVPNNDGNFLFAIAKIEHLKTSTGKKIPFSQEMSGSCDIVTEKLSVLERIFYNLRGIFRLR